MKQVRQFQLREGHWQVEFARSANHLPKVLPPQKRQGDGLDDPSGKRPKNSEVELVGSHPIVIVRLYKDRLDWDHIREA